MTVALSARLTRAPQGCSCQPPQATARPLATSRGVESADMVMPADVTIVLVRHGETEWSSSGRHTSFTDVPLTAHGRDEARPLAGRLAGVDFTLVLTSPRRRARATRARSPGSATAPRSPTTSPSGTTAGTRDARPSEIRDEVPDWTIFSHGAPGGETAERVATRADRVIAAGAVVRGRRRVVLARPLPAGPRCPLGRAPGVGGRVPRSRHRDAELPRPRTGAARAARVERVTVSS